MRAGKITRVTPPFCALRARYFAFLSAETAWHERPKGREGCSSMMPSDVMGRTASGLGDGVPGHPCGSVPP